MAAIVGYVWRHICPKPADQSIFCTRSKSKYIVLPRVTRVQGAAIQDLATLLKHKVQFGYLCDFEILLPPSKGTLTKTALGWLYKNNGTSGQDIFTYELIVFGQHSTPGTITINII